MNSASAVGAEADGMAVFATRSSDACERRADEPEHPLRSPFARDRDRIIHSRAFRRLEYKTQVFLNGSGDHYRTRMTHTIEVVAIARTLARGLKVNEDLTEAIALAHDLGHTPFGHVGERVLDKLLKNAGGFDHNEQSLRIIDCLEKKYPHMDGLNLTWGTRTGLVKRRGQAAKLDGVLLPPQPSMEAQIADLADDVAYYAHDVDDGVVAGLLDMEHLQEVKFWQLAYRQAVETGGEPDAPYFPSYAVRCLIDMLVDDIVRTTGERIALRKPRNPEDVTSNHEPLVSFSDDFQRGSDEFRSFLFNKLYWHSEVLDVNHRAEKAMKRLYAYFCAHPEAMGSGARARIQDNGIERAAADYLAGMTDLYAIQQYQERLGEVF